MIDIIIPSIRSSDKVKATLDSIEKNTVNPYRIFIVQEGDGYANALNIGYTLGSEPYIFCGADDLIFHKGWDSEIIDIFESNPGIMVVGTNDLHHAGTKKGTFSTHSMLRRSYCDNPGATCDGSAPIAGPYRHLFVDAEIVYTAMSRKVYQHAFNSHVEHIHPNWGLSDIDSVYKNGGLNSKKWRIDRATSKKRKRIWEKL